MAFEVQFLQTIKQTRLVMFSNFPLEEAKPGTHMEYDCITEVSEHLYKWYFS